MNETNTGIVKECTKEASTIEEAKLQIIDELGISADQIMFEILQEPQKKTLGLFGGSPAVVKGYFKLSPADNSVTYLKELLSSFDIASPEVEVISSTDESCNLSILGEDVGFIIGRRGETLDALQYLTGLVANRGREDYFRVTVDANKYREKREKTLRGLAIRIAKTSSRTGKKTSLEPMNPYERRIIHTAVQEIRGATSWSVGSGDFRHVIIGPSEDNHAAARASRNSRGQGQGQGNNNNRQQPRRRNDKPNQQNAPKYEKSSISRYDEDRPERPVRSFVSRSNPLPDADGSTVPSKTQSEKEDTSALYGRIDL